MMHFISMKEFHPSLPLSHTHTHSLSKKKWKFLQKYKCWQGIFLLSSTTTLSLWHFTWKQVTLRYLWCFPLLINHGSMFANVFFSFHFLGQDEGSIPRCTNLELCSLFGFQLPWQRKSGEFSSQHVSALPKLDQIVQYWENSWK